MEVVLILQCLNPLLKRALLNNYLELLNTDYSDDNLLHARKFFQGGSLFNELLSAVCSIFKSW